MATRMETPDEGASLEEAAAAALPHLFGHASLRPGQTDVLRLLGAGRDVLAVMPTGSGKSLCYQLPAMLLPGCTLVVSPLIALMKDQVDSLPPAVQSRTTLINSSLTREEIDRKLEAVGRGDFKLIYAAPERLRQQPFLHGLRRARISLVVVDEAHCVSLWGHDFRPDYLFVRGALEQLGQPALLALTATATPAIQAELGDRLGRPLARVSTGVLRPNLRLSVRALVNREEKLRALLEIVQACKGPAIIYVTAREEAERLAEFLRRKGISSAHYHAGLETAERAAVQERFMQDRIRVIAATVAFGMGIDKPNVRLIVHFSPPKSLEAYAQESGRAGRDGLPAECVLFHSPADAGNLRRWIRDEAIRASTLATVWQELRRLSRERYLLTAQESLLHSLARQLPSLEETGLRVSLSMLERAGLLIRHQDLPRFFAVVLSRPPDDAILARAVAGAQLAPRRNVRVEALVLARLAGVAPEAIERRLLEWQDSGALGYTASPRELLLELLPEPPDLQDRLERLVRDRAAAQDAHLRGILDYAAARVCRQATISGYFGEPSTAACAHCDVCAGAGDPVAPAARSTLEQPRRCDPAPVILECLRTLPFAMGRTGITRLLKGSVQSSIQADRAPLFGSLAALSERVIGDAIEVLVRDGYLARDDTEYRLLSLTAKGRAGAPLPPRPPVHVVEAANAEANDEAAVRLRDQLWVWRRQAAAEQGVSAFVVFPNRVLEAIITERPADAAALATLNGVGGEKLRRYGAAILAILARTAAES